MKQDKGLHPRNRHRKPYDFQRLIADSPKLAAFVSRNAFGIDTIDFANPDAVKALNKALLRTNYDITFWDLPETYLCPPVPGRADYIHYVADLLSERNNAAIPRGKSVRVLDIGMGANCIYPIIGHQEYGWRFVGTDIDPVAIRAAKQIVAANNALADTVECRLQHNAADIFKGVVQPGEVFALSICNPPFHASLDEAGTVAQRKWKNLGIDQTKASLRNFGGQKLELWYPGGEAAFIRNMILQSAEMPQACGWFTTLVSKKSNLPAIYKALENVRATDVRTIEMNQGQKVSRVVAWTFKDKKHTENG